MLGRVYNIAAEPIDEAHTVWFLADAVKFGLEYRRLALETVQQAREQLNEAASALAAQSFVPSEGWSLHVCGMEDGHEYLRFDCFDDDPHYHYLHRTARGEPIINHRIPFDVSAKGPMWQWVLQCLQSQLPEMLAEARGGDLAGQINPAAVQQATAAIGARLDEVA